MFKNHIIQVLIYAILMLPASCKNRTSSSGISNVDFKSTAGFADLPEELQSNALAIEGFLNLALEKNGFSIFDMQDKKVNLKEYQEDKEDNKGRRYYFKLTNLKLEHMGMQFFPKVDSVKKTIQIKIQTIDIRTKSVIKNSEQVISIDGDDFTSIFNNSSTNQEIYAQLAQIREKITSSSVASVNHFPIQSTSKAIIASLFCGVVMLFLGTILISVLKSRIGIGKTVIALCVLGVVVSAGSILARVDLEIYLAESKTKSLFLPVNWERNHLLLDKTVLK